MKKILFMIPNLSVGGAEKVLVNLVNNMDKTKYDITVLTLFAGGVNEQFLKSHITLKTCFKKTFRGNNHILKLFSPQTLYKKFIKDRYDIIVSYLEGPTARIVSGCTDKDTKLVSWIHCRTDSKKTASIGFRNFAEAKECYNKFHNTACVAQKTMEYFTETLDFKKPIEVLYNTNETEEIYQKSFEKVDDIEFSKDTVNICSVGKVEEIKGFMRLAKIHKKLKEQGIKTHIYIFGVGRQQAEIEKYLAENNLTDTFTFMGYKTNPYKYVAKCDLYVCSSRSEGFSTSTTESLIVGTPVVTVEVSGMKEMLGENNEFGIVTDNDDDALFEGIKRIITTEGLMEHYARQAEIRGKYFSRENTVKAVENMFMNL